MESKRNFTEQILAICDREKLLKRKSGKTYWKLINACQDPFFSTRDIAILLYGLSDNDDYDSVQCVVDEARKASSDNNKIISSMEYAVINDVLLNEIQERCLSMAAYISEEPCEQSSIEDIFYENSYHEKFELLAADLIRDAFKFDYQPDGSSF